MSKMPELRVKSIRTDHTQSGSAPTITVDTIWKWAPERNIKIRKVFIGFDHHPNTTLTYWTWLSKGAVDMANVTDLNEEEQLFAGLHIAVPATGTPANEHQFYNLSPDYVEIEDGEAIYFRCRTTGGTTGGYYVIIYYTG
ncbi:hypothetical protein ES708_28047 [subsurface metagenome]